MAWMVVLVLITLPVVEIALFIKSAQWMGILPTIGMAILAGAIGLALVRAQGFETLTRARNQLDRGEMPVREVFDGICLAVAGGLLLLPGFFSDILAVLLLLPPVRAVLRLMLMSKMSVVATHGPGPGTPPGRPPVIEAEYRVIDDDKTHRD